MDSTTSIPFISNQPLVIHLARQDELPRWQALMRQYYYLGFEHIVGSALYYVATVDDQWVALLGWGSAALKYGNRDQWIGWDQHLHIGAYIWSPTMSDSSFSPIATNRTWHQI